MPPAARCRTAGDVGSRSRSAARSIRKWPELEPPRSRSSRKRRVKLLLVWAKKGERIHTQTPRHTTPTPGPALLFKPPQGFPCIANKQLEVRQKRAVVPNSDPFIGHRVICVRQVPHVFLMARSPRWPDGPIFRLCCKPFINNNLHIGTVTVF